MFNRLCGALLFSVLPLLAADVSGNWKIAGGIGDYPIALNCTFKADGAKFTGVCKGGDRPDRSITGTVNGEKVEFQYDTEYNGDKLTVVYSGTLQTKTSMKGSIEVSGASGEFTGTKQ
jgi:hypothetical protein